MTLDWNSATTVMSSTSLGKAITMSTRRIATPSTHPPR